MLELAFTGSFHDVDVAQAVFERHAGLALLLDGLDEIGYFLDEWIHRLVRYLVALAGDGALRTGTKDVFPMMAPSSP